MAIAAFNKKKPRFTNKLDLMKEETSAALHFEHSCIWCWNLDTSESRSEIPGKFWNVVPERSVEFIWTDCVRNEEVLHKEN